VLPTEAKTYFDSLVSSASVDLSTRLAAQQREFERGEFARGQRPGGAGFAARLSELYKASLSARAQAIVEALRKAHSSFNSPLEAEVDGQLADWGARALSDAYQGLEGAYQRHLQRFGVELAHASGLDHAYSLAQVTVANLPRRYLWELRNVPALRPRPVGSGPTQVTINNSGTIGAVQTGAGATASIQQQWVTGDTSELRAALAELRKALERAQDIDPAVRGDVLADVDSIAAELEEERPNKGRLLRWLGGIGAVIGTVGSIQPAYDAVKALARALGLPV
jgi:hypothetical protein